MLVERERVAVLQVVGVLPEAASQGQRRRAHAIGDHEYEVPLPARLGEGGLLVMRNPDGEDQDAGSG